MNTVFSPGSFYSADEARNFVKRCEEDFERRLSGTADEVCAIPGIKLICLSGPTCSGKTTAANKLVSKFAGYGKKVNIISIDDFYYDKEKLRRISSEKGLSEVDYDSADTIDIEALAKFAEEIFSCREVHCPSFDFVRGKRSGYRTIKSSADDIFLFEGIQALYPQVTSLFEKYSFCSVYISPESSIDVAGTVFLPNEIRFLRRLVRDYNFRGSNADFTFSIWDSVRQNEEKNIFPFAHSCRFHIDSTFAYEISVLKPYLRRVLSGISPDSIYSDSAADILDKIAPSEELPKDYISPDSLYREFI